MVQFSFKQFYNVIAIAIAIAKAGTNAIAGSSDAIPWRQRCHFFAMSSVGDSWH